MFSETPNIIPFRSPFQSEVLTQSQLETLKGGTLTLLDEVGVHIPSQRALKIFADHGAKVDMDKETVRIPPDLVQKAMSTAPRSFVLAGREERFDLTLDGSCSYLCTEGCGAHVIDLETGKQRPSCKEDVAQSACVSDALPLISFYWPIITAQDHGGTAQLHDCHAALTNTLKHVRGGTTVHPKLTPYIVEMATVVAGSDGERRKRPPINANICTIAPLAHDKNGLESALIYAEAGIPVSFMAMTTMGSTAPATPLGALVVGDAEVVSGMVLIQLAYPGASVFHSDLVSLMDPLTGGYISDVPLPMAIMAVQLGHAWNVPSLGGGGVDTDSRENNWHSGMEGGMGSVFIPLAGAEISGHMGMTDAAMIFSPEKLILDHEICHSALEKLMEFEFNENDMSLNIIKKVGPRGHFLMETHTVKHIRDFRFSQILRKRDEEFNLRNPNEVALEEFRRINENHHPKPLPKEALAELDRILAAADRVAEKISQT